MIKLTETREITPYRWVHPDRGVIHPISFGVGLFHFLLTRRRQHRGVIFSLGEGHECKTKVVTTPRWRLFFASLVNLGTACAQTHLCWGI